MRVLGFDLRLVPVVAGLTLLPGGVHGQLRTVVSSEIAVSETEASLKLEFSDREGLTISLRDGQVFVDQDVLGSYSRRDDLDLAWRALLGDVITLEDGPLAQRLNDWNPPAELSGEESELADDLDRILEEALTAQPPSQDPAQAGVEGPVSQEGLVAALLSRTGSLGRLSEALEGASLDHFTLRIGEDVVVETGEVLEGNLILVDGDLDLNGRIEGDVIVVDGRVRLGEEGIVTGDLRISDGSVQDDGGSVTGQILQLATEDPIRLERSELEDLRRELESEIRRDLRNTSRPEVRGPNLFLGLLGNVGSAVAGLLETLVTFIILAILGVMAVHFQRDRLEVVATTARRAPVRAAVVGLAGGFFLIPVWIVGMIALAITIIGIPVLLAWVPLFPIAAGFAILFGYLAVARNVGEWVAEQEYRGLEWIRGSNTFYTIVAGLGALLVPAAAASASKILGFGFITGLLGFAGSMIMMIAAAVGFGAVLLTRGGKIRPLESYYEFEEDYWADVPPRTEDVSQPPPPEEDRKEDQEEGREEENDEQA